jgi:uncharacterized protein YoxC
MPGCLLICLTALKEGIPVYISLYDLALFILFVLLTVVCIYLIVFLRQGLAVLGMVRGVLESHQGDITETLTLLKETLANMNALTASLKETTEHTSKAVKAIPGEFTDSLEELQESFETFAFYAKLIVDIVKAVFVKSR